MPVAPSTLAIIFGLHKAAAVLAARHQSAVHPYPAFRAAVWLLFSFLHQTVGNKIPQAEHSARNIGGAVLHLDMIETA